MGDLGNEHSRPQTEGERTRDHGLCDEYRATRPYLANTLSAEAGRVLLGNREAMEQKKMDITITWT